MQINKNWKVESDDLNVILLKRHITKKGDERWVAVSYYAKVSNALKAFVDLKVRGTGMKDLETIVKKQDELYKMIENINKEVEL